MGRERQTEQRSEQFTKLVRNMMETPAWRALTPTAQALYPWLRLEWRGAQANNNGKIQLSTRQAASRLGVGLNTAARAYHELQAKGFLVVTEPARLGLGGEAKSPKFELTELELPHSSLRGGRRLYLQWQSGADFPVQKATAHNPNGRRRKTKPCHHFEDSNVTNLETGRHCFGDEMARFGLLHVTVLVTSLSTRGSGGGRLHCRRVQGATTAEVAP